MEEKKKTQGMRRDLAHHCGVLFVILGGVSFLGGRKLDEKENWEVGDSWYSFMPCRPPVFSVEKYF